MDRLADELGQRLVCREKQVYVRNTTAAVACFGLGDGPISTSQAVTHDIPPLVQGLDWPTRLVSRRSKAYY